MGCRAKAAQVPADVNVFEAMISAGAWTPSPEYLERQRKEVKPEAEAADAARLKVQNEAAEAARLKEEDEKTKATEEVASLKAEGVARAIVEAEAAEVARLKAEKEVVEAARLKEEEE